MKNSATMRFIPAPSGPQPPAARRLPADAATIASRRPICAACARNVNGSCVDCHSCGVTRDIERKIAAAMESCPHGYWSVEVIARQIEQ